MLALADGSLGHDLEALLAAAQDKGLSGLIKLTDEQAEEIRKANAYYVGKVFQYPALFEAVRGYPALPALALLTGAASVLVEALHKPCREA